MMDFWLENKGRGNVMENYMNGKDLIVDRMRTEKVEKGEIKDNTIELRRTRQGDKDRKIQS